MKSPYTLVVPNGSSLNSFRSNREVVQWRLRYLHRRTLQNVRELRVLIFSKWRENRSLDGCQAERRVISLGSRSRTLLKWNNVSVSTWSTILMCVPTSEVMSARPSLKHITSQRHLKRPARLSMFTMGPSTFIYPITSALLSTENY